MKKKRNNNFVYYLLLVILIILLLLPPGLRLFAKNLYVKEEKEKDVVEVLACEKHNESLSSTFLNGLPQHLDYKVKGNYTNNDDTSEKDSKTTNTEVIENDLLNHIREFSKVSYEDVEDVTLFEVKVTDMKQTSEYIVLFSSLDKQKNYFTSQAFSCQANTVAY